MAFVLTTSSDVNCPSRGAVTPAGQAKLIVAGAQVTRLDGITGKSVTGCTITDSSSTVQCKTVVSATGAAQKLHVNGAGVALATLSGTTNGSSPGLSASAGQSKLKAV
ncbi:hypothetical protein [Micromonospora zamorensis]|uniref:hypothetical protein n=1 Tax=Micromonospora zamorensis TaxID=709883 RepID=UPI00081FF62A|nr:hypothetical protein [Micromonospora zamorensis]SCG52951.1 hypothetical protein GA0070619_2838 [Micromonospora zamorensis]